MNKIVNGVQVALTPEEIAEFKAIEAAWAATEEDRILDALRTKRNALLAACDYTQLPDYRGEDKEVYEAYRQSLRDITDQDLYNVVWPDKP